MKKILSSDIVLKTIGVLLVSVFLIPREYNIRYSFLSFSITDIILLITIMSFFITKIRDIRTILKDKINIFIIVYVGYLLFIAALKILSGEISNKHLFLRDFYQYLTIIVFFIFYNVRIDTNKDLFRIVKLIFILYLLISIVTVSVSEIPFFQKLYIQQFVFYKDFGIKMGYRFQLSTPFVGGIFRPSDLIGGFGNVASASIVCLPLFYALKDELEKIISPILLFIAFIFMFLAVFYLMSKSNIIALLCSFLILLKIKRKVSYILILAPILLVISYCMGITKNIILRFSMIFSDSDRIAIYSKVIDEIKNNLIIGSGFGAVIKIDVFKEPLFNTYDSLYLEMLVKIGLIGTVMFVGFMVYLIAKGIKYLKDTDCSANSLEYSFVLGVISMFPGFLLMGMVAFLMSSISFNIFFWFILGIYARIINNSKNTY